MGRVSGHLTGPLGSAPVSPLPPAVAVAHHFPLPPTADSYRGCGDPYGVLGPGGTGAGVDLTPFFASGSGPGEPARERGWGCSCPTSPCPAPLLSLLVISLSLHRSMRNNQTSSSRACPHPIPSLTSSNEVPSVFLIFDGSLSYFLTTLYSVPHHRHQPNTKC